MTAGALLRFGADPSLRARTAGRSWEVKVMGGERYLHRIQAAESFGAAGTMVKRGARAEGFPGTSGRGGLRPPARFDLRQPSPADAVIGRERVATVQGASGAEVLP